MYTLTCAQRNTDARAWTAQASAKADQDDFLNLMWNSLSTKDMSMVKIFKKIRSVRPEI